MSDLQWRRISVDLEWGYSGEVVIAAVGGVDAVRRFGVGSYRGAAVTPPLGMTPRLRCVAVVYHRDTYRIDRGKRHFKMHYTKDQCARAVIGDGRLCRQHQAMQDRGRNLLTTDWHRYVE